MSDNPTIRQASGDGRTPRRVPALDGGPQQSTPTGGDGASKLTTKTVVEKIVDESDYPGEAAERIAADLCISFEEAIALVEDEDAKNDAR